MRFTLIEIGESRYIIDMGTQSIEELITKGIAVQSVKSIFITHMHSDHTTGLISFLDLCNRYFKKADPCVYLPGDMETAKAAIAAWIKCNGDGDMHPYRFFPVAKESSMMTA